MANDEAPKIEPNLTIVTDAPPLAGIEPEAAKTDAAPEAAKPEVVEAAKTDVAPEAIKPEIAETAKPEEAARRAPVAEAPTLPPAAQIAPVVAIDPPAKPESETVATAPAGVEPARSTRFALLAASVAIAASFGAVGGSLGVAKLGPMITSAPPPVEVSVNKEQMADEIKALKETVAQLRASTKGLSDNFAALKATMSSTTTAANAQSSKIAESLERIERTQAEQRRIAAAQPAPAAPETTGSVLPRPGAEHNPAPKNSIVQGWILRRVYDGAALIESRDGIIEVEPGVTAPGLGRIEGIKRLDGRWVVMTSRGMVVGR